MTNSRARQSELDYLSQYDIADFPNATYAVEGSEFVFTAQEIMDNQAKMEDEMYPEDYGYEADDYPTREEVRAMAEAELQAEYPF